MEFKSEITLSRIANQKCWCDDSAFINHLKFFIVSVFGIFFSSHRNKKTGSAWLCFSAWNIRVLLSHQLDLYSKVSWGISEMGLSRSSRLLWTSYRGLASGCKQSDTSGWVSSFLLYVPLLLHPISSAPLPHAWTGSITSSSSERCCCC